VGRVETVVTKHLRKMLRSHTQGSRTQPGQIRIN